MNSFIFREYDIRGVVGKDLTQDSVTMLGKGIGTYFVRQGKRKISIGGDVRLSTEDLKQWLAEGINSTGVDIVDIGAVPTGAQYFSLYHLEVDGGIMITGSHNPPEFNGFKISLDSGPVYGEMIQDIYRIIESGDFASGDGDVTKENIREAYLKDIADRVDLKRPVKVVIDCGNGAGSLVACELFDRIGAEATYLFCEPDGTFPNHHPDPTVLEFIQDLIAKVRETGAELGIGFDGDADRVGVVDENGNVIFGDKLTLILAREVLQRKPGSQIIFDVKCSQALEEVIKADGGKPLMWKTGHSLAKIKMKETGAPLGGEMSGHIFISDNFWGYDDAIYVAARLLDIVSRSDRKMSEHLDGIPNYPSTPEIRAEAESDAEKFRIAKEAADYFKANYDVIDVDGVRIKFEDGWALVRASNTQPVIVLRFEANTEERLAEIQEEVVTKLASFGKLRFGAH